MIEGGAMTSGAKAAIVGVVVVVIIVIILVVVFATSGSKSNGTSSGDKGPVVKTTVVEYTEYPDKDSWYGDIVNRTDLKGKVDELKAACTALPNCRGFNSNGVLKSTIQPQDKWKPAPGVSLWVRRD